MICDLSTVLGWLDINSEFLDIEVTGLCLDSRKITTGNVFIALCGYDNHGIDFAYQVQRGGACAIFAESIKQDKAKPKGRQQPLTIPVIEIENLSEKLGLIASNYYQNPSNHLDIIGITGTNGKTSSAWLLLQAWEKLGIKGAYIGTLGYGDLHQMHELQNTTPTALDLQIILAKFVKEGVTHVSFEVSSHGISLGRINNTQFKGAGFTNISRDHLDFHITMEEYSEAKKSLFMQFDLDFSVINTNDYYGNKWLDTLPSNVTTYGIESLQADLYASNIRLTPKGINFDLNWKSKSYPIATTLLGKFNVENILLVAGTLLSQNINIQKLVKTIPLLSPVPGRMNCVDTGQNNPLIIVDYAHTPDALKQVLLALKEHNAKNIWCVFGCGGNRDKGKRPQMGHIAEQLADQVIITDDNPRFEDNKQIVQDIVMGMNSKPVIIHQRKAAIEYAINHSHRDDLILIAGKGHEPYQLIKGHYHPFDDSIVAKDLLASTVKEKSA
jgi:UDP-N-acetylmuramoyl-L-alanyl-D-glutamate--2,6-diaminopimelate ligase